MQREGKQTKGERPKLAFSELCFTITSRCFLGNGVPDHPGNAATNCGVGGIRTDMTIAWPWQYKQM
jgi:hypothetical protein